MRRSREWLLKSAYFLKLALCPDANRRSCPPLPSFCPTKCDVPAVSVLASFERVKPFVTHAKSKPRHQARPLTDCAARLSVWIVIALQNPDLLSAISPLSQSFSPLSIRAVVGGHDSELYSPLSPKARGERGSGVRGADGCPLSVLLLLHLLITMEFSRSCLFG